MIALPFNSVINPLLYDDTLTNFLTGIARGAMTRCSTMTSYLRDRCANPAEQIQVTALEMDATNVGEGRVTLDIEPQVESNEEIVTETAM